MEWGTLILFVVGLALLVLGAELLVRGASGLAAAVGLSPLVIGLTVVAYGTSSPELAVSVQSSLSGQADIALGNVVGSNIFNVLFILGVSALFAPLVVAQQLIRVDVPLMIGVSILAWLMALDGRLQRLDGLALSAGAFGYTGFAVWLSRRERTKIKQEYAAEFGQPSGVGGQSLFWQILLVVSGLVALVIGSNWLVDGAVAFAKWCGLSELIIGLTIVAAGTSLPEVATSVLATLRGERDIAVGNVVGSNIFNILGVLGLSCVVAPDGVAASPSLVNFDLPVMIATAVACLPIFFTGHVIARWEGIIFLGYYAAYTTYLILAATQHSALPMFSSVMMLFVMPLTGLTVLVVALRSRR